MPVQMTAAATGGACPAERPAVGSQAVASVVAASPRLPGRR